MKKARRRHIAKTITWRIVGTIDTVVLSWIITGNPFTGLKIGIVEVFTKMILYYLHERFWFKSNITNTNKRHAIKTVTWRIIGTLDTMILGWLFTGNILVGIKIGITEILTKMILYFLHEKIWYRIDYGLESRYRK